jgi:hypothetical protein
MSTKVQKKVNVKHRMPAPLVSLKEDEHTLYKRFFSIKNMRAAFIAETNTPPSQAHNKRKSIERGLENNLWTVKVIKEVRAFYEAHKDEIAEFLDMVTIDKA